jgi:hypothetical protein
MQQLRRDLGLPQPMLAVISLTAGLPVYLWLRRK